ncbi:leucyl aminopeptidase [soil metagenome]
MHIRIVRERPSDIAISWFGVGLFEGQVTPPEPLSSMAGADRIGPLLADKEIPSGLGETTPILGLADPHPDSAPLMVVGLGRRESFGPGAAFSAGVALARRLASKPREVVALAVPEVEAATVAEIVSAMVQGVIVGTRGPGLRKSESNRHPFGKLILVLDPGQANAVEPEALDEAIRKGQILGEAINLARDLVNTPPAEKPPRRLAERAREVGEAAGLTVEVWDRDRIAREQFGGLIGVSAGSDEPPAFVTLDWKKGGDDAPTLALVGKGVTFDSGGLSLKPTASMEDMKADMSGAAIVLGALQAVARLGLKVNVVGYLALTENMTGGRALKLGDVLKMRNGKTVEILNTDAEGRLILADALSYAAEQKPDRMIDLATLTGACVVALGQKVAGLLGNDDALAGDVLSACRATGERAWRLPLDEDYREALKSQVADLKNVGGKWGGAITASKFLEEFVGGVPWMHIDIAGPSWADSDSSTRDAGATGCFVRTLVALLEATRTA